MAEKSLFGMGGMDFMLVLGLVGAFVGVCLLVTYLNLCGNRTLPPAAANPEAAPEQ